MAAKCRTPFCKNTSHGLGSRCFICIEKFSKVRKQFYAKQSHRKRLEKYDLTPAEYRRMLREQDHKCKICKRTQAETKKVLFVDHDHATGKVRGLLCNFCNALLGFGRDDEEILLRAVSYLRNCDK